MSIMAASGGDCVVNLGRKACTAQEDVNGGRGRGEKRERNRKGEERELVYLIAARVNRGQGVRAKHLGSRGVRRRERRGG